MAETPTGATVTRDGTPLYVAEPRDRPRGGVVVVQEAFGVNGHIESVCRRLAGEGYLAVAPHLFWRQGDPTFPYEGAMDRVQPAMRALRAEEIRADLAAALDELGARGLARSRCAVVGFCMGGTVATAVAAEEALAAAVSFYGGGVGEGRFGFPSLVELAPRLRTPWLGLYGGRDQGIPVEQAEALRDAAAGAGVATALTVYPEAGHGFNCDERASYHEPSARDAWGRMLSWLGEHLPEG